MTEPGLTIRPGGPHDLPLVAALERQSFTDPWTPASLLAELTPDPLRLPLVAECDRRLVGYLMAWRVVDQLHILNIAIDPDFRRRGVGTFLLRAAAREAVRSGMVELTLEVRRGNRGARDFYARHGFAEAGVRKGYYVDNGEDALVLTCPAIALAGDG